MSKSTFPKKTTPPKRNRESMRVREVNRVCVLTAGGDAPGLNAVLRAFVKTCFDLGIEVYGSEDGFEGLIQPNRMTKLDPSSVRGILPRGGSILGCSNRANPFSYPMQEAGGSENLVDVSADVVQRIADNHIDVLVLVGGDGTMNMGLRLAEMGVSVIGIPKTIDNDLGATDMTFGFDTALDTATWAIDALHSTAEAHDRVMILEVMGRYAGWIALSAGIAGGADVILLPEIPYEIDRVIDRVHKRSASGVAFSILVVGEGAKPKGGEESVIAPGRRGHLPRLGGAGHLVAAQLQGRVPHEVRVTVLGHLQRGGSPSAYDRLLGTRFGVAAARLCKEGRVGRMVRLSGTAIDSVPIAEAVGQSKLVTPESELVAAARCLGIELGAL